HHLLKRQGREEDVISPQRKTAGSQPAVFREAPASGVNLTFATHLAANLASECQIQNPARDLLLVIL
ncbi:MAG TPA: hypothetical protein VFS91_11155, partial [Nitrobacter sp.]|nr:hypothetical protein [Nitrobacter sp.]